jgi:catechol 2,3-dioxygenase-like lactoylglutathione lyase family enzyme
MTRDFALDHLHFRSADVSAAAAFYVTHFGAVESGEAGGVRILEGIKPAGIGISVAFVEGPDGILIELVETW